ncbi:hypothetical protein K2X89_14345, partial [Myxococcota bacterium]|nr:hypothetical protein [Myxococcota bacterium]
MHESNLRIAEQAEFIAYRLPELEASAPADSTHNMDLYDPPDGAGHRIVDRPGFQPTSYWQPPLIGAREAGWLIDCHAWFLEHFRKVIPLKRLRLVTPTSEAFPGVCAKPDRAQAIFEHCKRHAGLEDW